MKKSRREEDAPYIRQQILDMFHVTEEEIAALDEEGGFGEAHREARRQQALIRDDVVEAIRYVTIMPQPYRRGRTELPPPLTRRQKIRAWIAGRKWWLHDRLFPECRDDDD